VKLVMTADRNERPAAPTVFAISKETAKNRFRTVKMVRALDFDLAKECRQLSSQSQINFDIAGRRRTTDQHIPGGWRLEWIRLIVDTASDQCALAGMADPCAARPLYGNVASFCKFQQTGKP
jgi:hypothetical protein